MRVLAGVLCFMILVASGACHNTGPDRQENADVARSGESSVGSRQENLKGSVVTGTIRRIDLEGGFFGIETEDGAKLDPVNLPAEFQQDGLRIRARVEQLKDRVSFHMWGSLVRILSIERL